MEELIIWCRYFMQANIATGHASLALISPLELLQGECMVTPIMATGPSSLTTIESLVVAVLIVQ